MVFCESPERMDAGVIGKIDVMTFVLTIYNLLSREFALQLVFLKEQRRGPGIIYNI